MAIDKIFSFLVPPMFGAKDFSAIKGSEVPLVGKTYDLLAEIYDNAPDACRVDIAFEQTGGDGVQENEVRSEVIEYTLNPCEETAFPLAARLASVSTNRSKLGLLFLVKGTEDTRTRTLVARFPADNAILADITSGSLVLEFLERVFLKSARSFKAVVYQDVNPKYTYWRGKAIDRQVNHTDTEIRAYWVQDFLQSAYLTTSAEGTRRLGAAMRDAANATTDDEIREEIMAAVKLARNIGGQTLTGEQFFDKFSLSPKTRAAITEKLSDAKVLTDTFRFDISEFATQLPYRTISLNNGASLTGPSENFDNVFTQEIIDSDGGGQIRISTIGTVIDQSLGRRK